MVSEPDSWGCNAFHFGLGFDSERTVRLPLLKDVEGLDARFELLKLYWLPNAAGDEPWPPIPAIHVLRLAQKSALVEILGVGRQPFFLKIRGPSHFALNQSRLKYD